MRRRIRGGQGITILDALITLCLMGVLVGVVLPHYQRLALEAQKEALKTELVNIRSSITLFKMLNGRNPRSLWEMVEKDVLFPARIGRTPYSGSVFKQKYLLANAVDRHGNLLDAFGNPFNYDPARGEVRSSTGGYEAW